MGFAPSNHSLIYGLDENNQAQAMPMLNGKLAVDTQVTVTDVTVDNVTLDTGNPIDGQSLEAGGSDLLGWLSSIRARLATLGQKNMAGSVPVVIASDQDAVPVAGPLTDDELRAAPVDIAFDGAQPVTGTFWQATQPVSGPLTDAQLRASAVPVSGTFYQATQPVSDAVIGATTDAEAASGNGTLVAILKRIRTLLAGGLPAALTASGNLKVAIQEGSSSTVITTQGKQTINVFVDENGNIVNQKVAWARCTSSGANQVIAVVTSKKLRVLSYQIQSEGTVTAYFRDDTPTQLSMQWVLQAREGAIPVAYSGGGWLFETAAGKKLELYLSGAVAVNVQVQYIEI